MDIHDMLRTFCGAVERRDGTAFAALFTDDGVYHDVFYGTFEGRQKIADMIDDWFYRSATAFRWLMHDPVCDGTTLYARYTFSYRSTLPEADGARVIVDGVAIMTLRGAKIATYDEIADVGPALTDMKFESARIGKFMSKRAAALRARPDMRRHLAD